MIMYFLRFIISKMSVASLITPSDTHTSVKQTHMFLIANMVVIVLILGGTIGWLFYASKEKKYPYKQYTRKTGPPGTHPMNQHKAVNNSPST